jgi:phenylacetic acid degradation operon negative regulatory protein
LTILGELVLPTGAPVWTSALLYVLGGLGLEEQTARQAIARGAAAGWIVGEKRGREVRWVLSEAGIGTIEEGSRRVYSMSAPREPWEGDWLILLVTISQRQKAVRKRLYSALSWAGFGSPAAGVWLNPHLDRADEAKSIIHDLDLQDSTIGFVGPSLSLGIAENEIVRRAWDLETVESRYEKLIERFVALDPDSGDDFLFTHIALVSEWQRFPFLDPQLPEELLPGWIGRRAAELFVNLRAKWADETHARWKEVVTFTSPPG